MPTHGKSAIVLVVDRFGAGYLGPYGNTWLDTPGLNRLASQSYVCEFAIVDTPRLDRVYRSYWQGVHAMTPGELVTATSLPARLASQQIDTSLLTDEPTVAELAGAADFARHNLLGGATADQAAEEVGQTSLARIFTTAAEVVGQMEAPYLLWIHARGMQAPWDAPLEMRRALAEEDDPVPPDFVRVPCWTLEEDYDPDDLLGIVHAYAGQVVLLDMLLDGLLRVVAESPLAEDTLLAFTSSRGFPLGEHQRVADPDDRLYGELLHVPWMLRCPDGRGTMRRSQSLVQPVDLFGTLADWFSVSLESEAAHSFSLLPRLDDESCPGRDRACAVGADQRAIRTRSWFLKTAPPTADDQTNSVELYAKPDDRWEKNEVSTLCPDVVEALQAALEEYEAAVRAGRLDEISPLPSHLTEGDRE